MITAMITSVIIDMEKMREAFNRINCWMVENLINIDPLSGDAPEEFYFKRKCFNEIAFYLTFVKVLTKKALTPELKKIHEYVVSKLNGEYIDLAHREPKALMVYTDAIAYGLYADALTKSQKNMVRSLFSSSFAWGIRRPMYQKMQLCFASRMADLEMDNEVQALLALSRKCNPPSPIYGEHSDLLAFTHSVIYSFHISPISMNDAPSDSIVDGWLCRLYAEGELDLALQLCCASALYGRNEHMAGKIVIYQSVKALLEGELLCSEDQGVARRYSAATGDNSRWAYAFHTMLVAGMAFAAILQCKEYRIDPGEEKQKADVLARGVIFTELHEYKLQHAFESATRYIENPLADRLNKYRLVEIMEEFIKLSKREDGGIGHYVDVFRKCIANGAINDFNDSLYRLRKTYEMYTKVVKNVL